MKRIRFGPVLLLGMYVLASMRPYLPLLEYELNRSYIVRELCVNRFQPELNCDGKCYLAQKLKEASAHQPQDATLPPAFHPEDFLAAHLVPASIRWVRGLACLFSFPEAAIYCEWYPFVDLPPPRSVA